MKQSRIHRLIPGTALFAALTACQMEPSGLSFGEATCVSADASYDGFTKAALTTEVPDTFTLYACSYSGSTPTGVDYIYGETMTKSDSKWMSSNKFAKVASDRTVKYFAVHPSNATGLTLPGAETAGAPVFGYTLPGDASSQSDIIVASKDYSGSQDNITLAFNHILAAVDFKFASDGAFNGTIKSISIKNVNTKGNYTLGSGWGGLSTLGAVTQTLNKTVTEGMGGSAITSSSDALILIPQTAPSGAVLEIKVSDGAVDVTMECDLSGQTFEADKEYTVSLNLSGAFSGGGIVVLGVDVTDWVNDVMGTGSGGGELSAEYSVSAQTAVSLPAATFAAGTAVSIDWGDGDIEVKKRISGGVVTLSHTYASAYTGKVKISVKEGSIDFGEIKPKYFDALTVYDSGKVKKELKQDFVFTVDNIGKKVKFAPGNLRYNVELYTFDFMPNQYDYQESFSYKTITLFLWSPSVDVAVSTSTSVSGSVTDKFFAADGGAIEGWTVLSRDEWDYVINHALAKNSSSKNTITISGKKCIVLKPDGFSGTVADSYTAEQWSAAEDQYGLVALPFAGYRSGYTIYYGGSYGYYWSGTPYASNASLAYDAEFNPSSASTGWYNRYGGYSVRLVQVQ